MATKRSSKPQFSILLILVSFASVGAVLFTPALPSIQEFFDISVGKAQLTVTTYLIGYAFAQLPYGPIANRYGRKPALYLGISLAIIGSLLCALSAPAHSFGLLLFGRIIQALGASVGLKVSFTMIADAFDQTAATKTISKLLLSFAVMPSLAIGIGGWLTQRFEWQSCFYFLVFFSFASLFLVARLPETAPSLDPQALRLPSIIAAYRAKLSNARLVTSGLIMGCGTAVIYIFASKAPFIGIKLIGLNPEQFGLYNFIPLIGMVSGSLLGSRLAGRFSLINLLGGGIIGTLIATMTMLVPFATGLVTTWTLFVPMVLIYIAESVIYAHISSFALTGAKNKSNASAVLNWINMSVAVIAVLLAEFIYPEDALIMPVSFAFFFLVMLLLWFRLRKLAA
ncbi:MAG: multidrug effflux MFS transporter [Parachlamydiales bacterium]|nr:multidrug effflux MFS transporter [Verrucomicrobiota bacterium]MBX3719492.1 multidrug effflux MFS transporter [Candidatus Acheromyda pituitae]